MLNTFLLNSTCKFVEKIFNVKDFYYVELYERRGVKVKESLSFGEEMRPNAHIERLTAADRKFSLRSAALLTGLTT